MGGTSAVLGAYTLYKADCGSCALSSRFNGTSTTGSINLKVINAQDDAATFLASEGAIRGVAFDSAIAAIRESNPNLTLSDAELAQEILSIE